MKFVPKELRKTADISRGSTQWRTSVGRAAAVGLALAVLYGLLGLAAEFVASRIPDHWEARGFALAVEATPTAMPPPEMERAHAVFQRLLETPGLRVLPYRLFVLDSRAPNAVAVPGGGVGVTRGLLEQVTGETGLAMVLGHELGHHQGRHSLRRLGRGLIYRLALALLFGNTGPSLVDLSLQAAESGYSRQQERDADDFGLRLVHRTYGHTEGALDFFEQVRRESKSHPARWASFLASHPYTPDRITALRNLARTLPAAVK